MIQPYIINVGFHLNNRATAGEMMCDKIYIRICLVVTVYGILYFVLVSHFLENIFRKREPSYEKGQEKMSEGLFGSDVVNPQLKVGHGNHSLYIKANQKASSPHDKLKVDAPSVDILPFSKFSYPLDVNLSQLVKTVKQHGIVKSVAINVFKYKHIYNPYPLCAQDPNFILFVVKSAYNNRDQRDAIRHTWGKGGYTGNYRVRTVFTVGLSSSDSNSEMVEEYREYGDILQTNFLDSYSNNTLKMISAINWVATYCSETDFVILMDDDFYVALETLIKLLDSLPLDLRHGLYLGHVISDGKPIREKGNKWYVSPLEYRYDKYPSFINAGTVILSMDLVMEVQIAMQYTAMFPLDDIYLAIVMYKLGVSPVDSSRFCNCRVLPNDPLPFRFIATAHGYSPGDLIWAWSKHKKKRDLVLT